MLRFLSDFWRTVREPSVFRRCGPIALIVGTLLTLVNQGDLLVAGSFDRVLALKILGNFSIPFVVSNLGAMTQRPRRPNGPEWPGR